ncbi:unnamed protein product [Symbiodinium sp. CCMP2592]|nr:unnamed protein product [Symbiodinium sp. CCMP2592]CAE7830353.1 unnamed protein product [Symbiodinium sp. CCMP2592]CAE7838676.1 unnamed protein product [Symbiodinium sp. CCMP2592]
MSEGHAPDDAVPMDTSDVAVAGDAAADAVPTVSPSDPSGSEMEVEHDDSDSDDSYSEVSVGPHEPDVAAGVGPPSVPTTLDRVGPVLPGSQIHVQYHTHNHWCTTTHNHYHSHAAYRHKHKHITKHIHVQMRATPAPTVSTLPSPKAVLDANDDGAHNGEHQTWPCLTAAPADAIDLTSDSDSDVVLEHDHGSRDSTGNGEAGCSHDCATEIDEVQENETTSEHSEDLEVHRADGPDGSSSSSSDDAPLCAGSLCS